MTENLLAKLAIATKQLDITLSSNQQQQLIDYVQQLYKWNQTYNLSAVREIDAIWQRHIIDSLSIIPYLIDNEQQSPNAIADIGSGAGLPGIVIAIVLPEIKVYLVESIGKKCRFLRHITQTLQLDNVQIINERVENWHPLSASKKDNAQNSLQIQDNEQNTPNKELDKIAPIDIIICRAFTDLKHFIKITTHLAPTDNIRWLAMKSAHTESEENDLQQHLAELIQPNQTNSEYEYSLKNVKLLVPFEVADRHLIILTRSNK